MSRNYKAILIPHDNNKQVEVVDMDSSDYREITRKVAADPVNGLFSCSTIGGGRCSLWYDDEGLFNQPTNVNTRAMALWASIDRVDIRDFAVPLVGDYLVTGPADDEGYTTDVPIDIVTLLIGKRVD